MTETFFLDPMSKFHSTQDPRPPLRQSASATRKMFLSGGSITESSLQRTVEIPLICGNNVTMVSPDPLSKFHEGPGPIYSESASPMSLQDYSPMNLDKENIHANKMPLVYGSHVTMASPDPLSKFHDEFTEQSFRPKNNVHATISASRAINESSHYYQIESPDPLSKFKDRDVPDISTFVTSPDSKLNQNIKNFRGRLYEASMDEKRCPDSCEVITGNSLCETEREKEIQQSFFTNVIPKSRIRAIQELRKSNELIPILLEPKPPSSAPQKDKPQRPGPRRVVCLPKSKEISLDVTSAANDKIALHSPDSISANLSPEGYNPETKTSIHSFTEVQPENLLGTMKLEGNASKISEIHVEMNIQRPSRRRSFNYSIPDNSPMIDVTETIEENKSPTLSLPQKYVGDKFYKRGGKLHLFSLELEILPESSEINYAFPGKFQHNLDDIKHALIISCKRKKKNRISFSNPEIESEYKEEILDEKQQALQEDYVFRYCRRFTRENKTISFLFSEILRKNGFVSFSPLSPALGTS